jgi:hypothetical protein
VKGTILMLPVQQPWSNFLWCSVLIRIGVITIKNWRHLIITGVYKDCRAWGPYQASRRLKWLLNSSSNPEGSFSWTSAARHLRVHLLTCGAGVLLPRLRPRHSGVEDPPPHLRHLNLPPSPLLYFLSTWWENEREQEGIPKFPVQVRALSCSLFVIDDSSAQG